MSSGSQTNEVSIAAERRVDRVAALAQHIGPRPGGQGMAGRDDPELGLGHGGGYRRGMNSGTSSSVAEAD